MSSSHQINSPNESKISSPGIFDINRMTEEEQDEVILNAEAIKEAHICSNSEALRAKKLDLLTENETIALVRAAKKIILHRLSQQMKQGLMDSDEGVDKLCERIEQEVLRVKNKRLIFYSCLQNFDLEGYHAD